MHWLLYKKLLQKQNLKENSSIFDDQKAKVLAQFLLYLINLIIKFCLQQLLARDDLKGFCIDQILMALKKDNQPSK